jgi:GNAT superfamily N-acetyltransferase
LLSVDPARQQGGLGSFLMDAAENYCRERGSRFMDIYIVNLRTELPAFYQRRGYVATGTTPFLEDVETKLPCHFINMSKPL